MKLSENNQGVGERQLVENLRFPSRFCQKLKSLKMPQCQYAIAIHSNHTPPSHTLHPISKPSHVLDFLMSTSTIFNSTIYASHFVFCFRCTISQNIFHMCPLSPGKTPTSKRNLAPRSPKLCNRTGLVACGVADSKRSYEVS